MKQPLYILTHSYYPGSTADAVRIMSFYELLKDEFRLTLVTSGESESVGGEEVISLKQNTNFSSSNIIRLFRELRLAYFFIKVVKKIPHSTKLLISSPPYVTFLIVRIYCKLRKRRFIHDLRDPYPEIMTSNTLLKKLFYALEKWLLSATSAILVTTEGLQKHLSKKLHFSTIDLIENGHNFHSNPSPKLPGEKFVVGVLGNIGKFQDIDLLAKLVAGTKGSNIHFEIYGSGSALYKLIAKTADYKHCTIHGRIPHDEVEHVLEHFDLGLAIRKKSEINELVIPVRTFEYIGKGIPLIMVPKTTFSKNLENRDLAFCFNNDEVNEIINTIISLSKKPKDLAVISQNQIEVKDQYSRFLVKSKLLKALLRD